MKEQLYTIPLMDAFHSEDECPFCFLERNLEQNALEFILGTAYMESDIRETTDREGFCRRHLKYMYDYGNSLGNALMLKTHYQLLNRELKEQIAHFSAGKRNPFHSISKKGTSSGNSIVSWIHQKRNSCYLCNYVSNTYQRYLDTFFHLYRKDPEFHTLIAEGKGFCLHHFGELMELSESKMNTHEKESFYPMIFSVMERNMKRLEEDLSWFVNKFDYRYKDEDWKNSRDAIPRGMQKLHGQTEPPVGK